MITKIITFWKKLVSLFKNNESPSNMESIVIVIATEIPKKEETKFSNGISTTVERVDFQEYVKYMKEHNYPMILEGFYYYKITNSFQVIK